MGESVHTRSFLALDGCGSGGFFCVLLVGFGLCHLRDTEIEVVLPQQAQVLEELNPFIVREDMTQLVLERAYNSSTQSTLQFVFPQ